MNLFGLGVHIDDIVAVLEFERLRDVVLCGASYGGLPATGAADRAADRVRLLVYIDGLVPVPGRPPMTSSPPGSLAWSATALPNTGQRGGCRCRRGSSMR